MRNYWVGVINPIHGDALSYIDDPDNYSGGTPADDIELLMGMLCDPKRLLSMFKSYTGRYLYSLYVDDQERFDQLISDYPSMLELGCWEMSGTRIGDLHPSLINHMPLGVMSDVVLLGDQQPRSLS